MRQWTGIHDERTNIGDGLTMLRNVSLITQGQLQRRPQLGTKYTLGAALLIDLHPRQGGDFLIAADGSGKIVSVNLDDNTSTDLATGLDADIRGCFVGHQQSVYYTNDFNSVQRVNTGTGTAVSAGMVGPVSAPTFSSNSTGSLTTGAYRIRYRYKDTRTGYVSNPSAEYTQTFTAASQSIRVSGAAAADAKANQIVWERTTAGGSAFYQDTLGTNDTTVVALTSSDATLSAGIAIASYYGDFGHEPPPISELLCEHRGRIFSFKTSTRQRTVSAALSAASITGTNFSANWVGRLVSFSGTSSVSYVVSSVSASGTSLTLATNYAGVTATAVSINVYSPTPDALGWSRAGYPESWKPSEWMRRVLNNGDRPSALFSAYDTLWLSGQSSLKSFDYTSDPAAAKIGTVPTQLGIFNQRCIVNAEGRVLCFGASGVFEMKGRVPTSISDAIYQTFIGLVDVAQFEANHATYDYIDDTATFWFCRTGDTIPKDALAYHLGTGEWQLRTWRQAIKSSAVIRGTGLFPRPYLGCENGYVWRLDDSRFGDGLLTSMTTGVVTVTAGASATVIPVTESLPTSSSASANLSGLMLYNPATGTAKAVTSNAANSLTCAAFSAAPAAGTELYLGSVDVGLTSEWWDGPGPHALKRPSYLAIEHDSDDVSPSIDIQLYKELSSTPLTFTKGSGDSQLSGVTYTNGATTASLDTSLRGGVLYLNCMQEWAHYWRYVISQTRPAGYLKLMDAKFLLRNREEVDPKVKPT